MRHSEEAGSYLGLLPAFGEGKLSFLYSHRLSGMNQMTKGKPPSASLKATPGNLMVDQKTIPRIPANNPSAPNTLVSFSKVKRMPSRIEQAISEKKHPRANRTCMTRKASEKNPTPAVDRPTKISPIAPSRPSRLPYSTRAREIANIDSRIPVTIRPRLKIGAASETPKSLRALLVQLNQGERATEMPVDTIAQRSDITPSQAAILGRKNILSLEGMSFDIKTPAHALRI